MKIQDRDLGHLADLQIADLLALVKQKEDEHLVGRNLKLEAGLRV